MNIQKLAVGEQVELMEMMDARERRLSIQTRLLKEWNRPLVSFTLNIVGPVKVFPLTIKTFREGSALIESQCRAWKLPILHTEVLEEKTGHEQFWVVDAEAKTIKETLCRLEEAVSMGRLFDIDVIQTNGEKVSRSDLDLPSRKCLLCGNDAHACGRSRTHSVPELLNRECELMEDYFNRKYARELSSLAMQALLYEVSATPKPGLVDRANNGSHKDMDLFTFERSAVSLHHYFEEFVLCGIVNAEKELPRIFSRIRPLGVQAEDSMLQATGGVNTHKGLIFSLGIICCALGYLYAKQIPYSPEAMMKTCREMTAPVLGDFNAVTLETAHTNGERLYARYGIKGARGEAASGYRSVFAIGLPHLKYYLAQGLSANDAGILTLLHIIAESEDTNIIARSSYETMKEVQTRIRALLSQKDLLTSDYTGAIRQLDADFMRINISPGGSADLLALTYFAYFLEELHSPASS